MLREEGVVGRQTHGKVERVALGFTRLGTRVEVVIRVEEIIHGCRERRWPILLMLGGGLSER